MKPNRFTSNSFLDRLPEAMNGEVTKLNPEFMNNIFKVKENKRLVRKQYKLNLETPEWNQVTFGAKSLKVYGSKVWNNLPFHIKTSENLVQF